MTKIQHSLLKFGALQTILMACYHFFIPAQFGWGDYLLESSPTINWALYSIHNYFCFNLLVLGSFLMFFLLKRKTSLQTIITLSLMLLIFWIFSAGYQLVDPMPLPARLSWLGILLPGVAILNALVFAVPLRGLMKKE